MGKEDSSVKKRRKVNSTDASSKTEPIDVYKRVIDYEEQESQSRSASEDAALFRKTCQKIRQLLSDISELKANDSTESKEKINAKKTEASLLIVALKKLNRLEKVRTRCGREALHKEKQRVDSTHLLLQNLLYEADYLNKEVTKCLQFKSQDEEIDLIPLEDFFKEAPPEITNSETIKDDEHQLQLARLEWELCQRRELSKVCEELVASKERVSAAIAATRSRLDSLAPHLQDVLKATKPLQECLSMRLDEKRDQTRTAQLLPQPLFVLYANTSAFSDILETKHVTAAVLGDEDEARRLEQQMNVDTNAALSDTDSDQENYDEDASKKKRHHRTTKISKEERAEAKKRDILKKHPLNVQISVKCNDGTTVNLIFSYLLKLKFVVVKFTVTLARPVIGVTAADVLTGHSILNELYPGDTGNVAPHPATSYLLNSAGMSEDFQKFIPEAGRPFIWAQRMCGLDYMTMALNNQNLSLTPCSNLSMVTIENFLSTLRKRIKYRVALMNELLELENGKILPIKDDSLLSLRSFGSLTQWQSIAWAEYSQSPSTEFFISEGLVSSEDMLYRAIITRQSAKLVAHVALKNDYPKVAPLFSLTLHWNGSAHHAGDSDDIRDIERVVNTEFNMIKDKHNTLSQQMRKLLNCIDILLETTGSSEFPPDKIIFRSVQGRNRIKPFKFLNKGSGLFIHF